MMQADFLNEKASHHERLERAFVDIVAERVEKRGWKKIDFATKIWPHTSRKAASSKWTDIRGTVAKTGKPQSLGLAEALKMAEVLGFELNYLLVLAQERLNGEDEKRPDK